MKTKKPHYTNCLHGTFGKYEVRQIGGLGNVKCRLLTDTHNTRDRSQVL